MGEIGNMKIIVTFVPSYWKCVEWTRWHSKSLKENWDWSYNNQFIATTWE